MYKIEFEYFNKTGLELDPVYTTKPTEQKVRPFGMQRKSMGIQKDSTGI